MYIPAHFRVEDKDVLYALMQEYSFATLVTQGEVGMSATHLPFLVDATSGAQGALRGHLARANAQWRQLETGQEALVIFQGPHAYISPSWYEAHPSVPTWNYAVVHAYGTPRLLDDGELLETLKASVAFYESGFEQPWRMDTLTEDYVEKMMRGIVGFEIEVTRLEGKLKLNQNRSQTDNARVVSALEESRTTPDTATAAWMRRVNGIE